MRESITSPRVARAAVTRRRCDDDDATTMRRRWLAQVPLDLAYHTTMLGSNVCGFVGGAWFVFNQSDGPQVRATSRHAGSLLARF